MNPNNNDPSNTPPAGNTPPVQSPAADRPVVSNDTPEPAFGAPEASVTPAETPDTPAETTPVASVGATPASAQADPLTTAVNAEPTPVSAFGGAPVGPDAPKQPNKKQLVTIAAIVGGVLLLAIAGFVAYTLLLAVSKEDYKAATQQFNKVNSASSSLSSDVSGLSAATNSSSEDTFEEAIAEVETAMTQLKAEDTELAKLKAIKVGEGAKLYKEFNTKLTTYLAYGEGFVTSVKNLRPALVTCRSTNAATSNAARAAALQDCAKALEGVTDIPNAEMKTYVAAITDGYKSYASLYGQVAGLTNPMGSQYEQYKTLRDQIYEVQDTISEASDTFSDAVEKKGDEVSVKASADALSEYLSENQR